VYQPCTLLVGTNRRPNRPKFFARPAAGLEPGMLSPLAQLTVINGAVERDDLYYFQVHGVEVSGGVEVLSPARVAYLQQQCLR